MSLPFPVRAGVRAGVVLAMLASGPATAAADWTATAGDLGTNASRFAVHVGGSWGPINGTEVEKVDPATGLEVGVSGRVWRSFSLYGSYATSQGSVKGQIVQLLDQPIRADGRSGTVDGDVSFRRFRAGVRIDGLRQEDWPFQAYFVGAAVFSTNEVKLNSVDGRPPQVLDLPDGGTLDLAKFDDSQLGFLGRIGVEYLLTTRFWVYTNFTYEVIEPPPGTNATASVNGGLTIRI
jgi:hypothetical protein